MLKQSENKAGNTVTVSGQAYRRVDFEDPRQPGFTVPGRLFSSAELIACGLLDLTAPSGHRFSAHLPLPYTPDPAVVSGSETPRELRAELDAAEEARAAWMRRRGELFETGRQATNRWQLAAQQRNAKAYDSALAEELRVAEQLRDIAAEEPLLVRRIAKAHDAIRHWQYVERLRRTEAAAGQ